MAKPSLLPSYHPCRGGSCSTSTLQRHPIYLSVRWRSRCTWAARTLEPRSVLAIATGAVDVRSAPRPGETADLTLMDKIDTLNDAACTLAAVRAALPAAASVSIYRGQEINCAESQSQSPRAIKPYVTLRGVPRWRDRFPQYGMKVRLWGSGPLKIVNPVENHPQKTKSRLADYHPLCGWGVLISVHIYVFTIHVTCTYRIGTA